MSSATENILDFILSKDRKVSSKAVLIIFSLLTLLIVNDYFGLAFYYNADKKIEELKKISELISSPQSDSSTRFYAINLRKEVIEKEGFIPHLFSSARRNLSNNSIIVNDKSTANNENSIKSAIKSNSWFIISTSGVFFLFAIIFSISLLFIDKVTPLNQRIFAAIICAVILIVFGFIFYWAFSFIPLIGDSWIWNYILNYTLQVVIITATIFLIAKKPK